MHEPDTPTHDSVPAAGPPEADARPWWAVPFSVARDEPLAAGLERIATSLLDRAAKQLEDPLLDRRVAIHEARKAMKRVRALLRMVRPQLGKKRFRRENRTMRDAARLISAARDADVLVEAFDGLVAASPEGGLTGLRAELVAIADERAASLDEKAIEQVVGVLRAAGRRVAGWQLSAPSDEFDLVSGGICRTYRLARKAMRVAYGDGTAEAFHEWRKQVKHIGYHTEFLQPAWPVEHEDVEQYLNLMAEALGDEHDLAVLGATVADLGLGEAADRDRLQAMIEQRRRQLHHVIRPMGERVFADKPRRFTSRLHAYWREWRAGG